MRNGHGDGVGEGAQRGDGSGSGVDEGVGIGTGAHSTITGFSIAFTDMKFTLPSVKTPVKRGPCTLSPCNE